MLDNNMCGELIIGETKMMVTPLLYHGTFITNQLNMCMAILSYLVNFHQKLC